MAPEFSPTALAEPLYGVWRGVRKPLAPGLVDRTPETVAREPENQATLAAARERGKRRDRWFLR